MENTTSTQNKSIPIISENSFENQEGNEYCSKAIKKVNEQARSVSGQNVPAIAIYHYLIDKCSNNDFAQCVINEEKSLSECFSYITEKAFEKGSQTQAANNMPFSVGMSSDEIFKLVDEYFILSNAEIEKRKKQKLKEIEATRAANEKIRAQKIADTAKKKAEAKNEKTKSKSVTKSNTENQISLFDMQEGD